MTYDDQTAHKGTKPLRNAYKWAVTRFGTFARVEGFIRWKGFSRTRFEMIEDLERLYKSTGKFAFQACANDAKLHNAFWIEKKTRQA